MAGILAQIAAGAIGGAAESISESAAGNLEALRIERRDERLQKYRLEEQSREFGWRSAESEKDRAFRSGESALDRSSTKELWEMRESAADRRQRQADERAMAREKLKLEGTGSKAWDDLYKGLSPDLRAFFETDKVDANGRPVMLLDAMGNQTVAKEPDTDMLAAYTAWAKRNDVSDPRDYDTAMRFVQRYRQLEDRFGDLTSEGWDIGVDTKGELKLAPPPGMSLNDAANILRERRGAPTAEATDAPTSARPPGAQTASPTAAQGAATPAPTAPRPGSLASVAQSAQASQNTPASSVSPTVGVKEIVEMDATQLRATIATLRQQAERASGAEKRQFERLIRYAEQRLNS